MEIDWTFLLSAIYCGIGVLVIVIGLFAGKQAEESKKRFEEKLNSHFFETSVITLTIMVMMVIFWLPYIIWSAIDAWKVTDGGRK
jgi:heme/copper-type cytochrome/quinol oxidase subunit 2